jgi:flagellar assembly factor FliW
MSSSAALALAAAPMIIESDLLGSLAVEPEELLTFAAGIFGFPDCRQFVLVPAEREGLFWLQSVEHRPLAFLLADPFHFFPDYAVDLGAAERAELGVQDASEVAILSIVTLPRTRAERPTTNLQGPLVFNMSNRLGRQLAIAEPEWGLRREIDLAAAQA